jgi:hypothetical protein
MCALPAASRKPRYAWFGIILQCLPLLFAAGCTAYVTSASTKWFAPVALMASYLGLSMAGWGLGYVYLRCWQRFILTWQGGIAFGLALAVANYHVTFFCIDLETTDCYQREAVADRPIAVVSVLLVIVTVALLAYDVWRLAVRRTMSGL